MSKLATMKNILDLKYTEAREFFLKDESYFNFDLPGYFTFTKLLTDISQKINSKDLSCFYLANRNPRSLENVNYKLFSNKDGRYAWRLLQLIHPVLYASLVNKITEENHWNAVIQTFKQFEKKAIVECASLPVISSKEKQSDKATQILTWLEEVEQKSIALALKYDFIFHADITDCYGSIYTHSIPWALHTKERAKQERNSKDLIGNIIDSHLRDMSYGQTNGIPQGSVLMDFIAEMVLGYVDCELTKRIKNLDDGDHQIIRYRDDYRIFVNNPQTGDEIVKELATTLGELGMRLNADKIKFSSDVIDSSIKPDKLFWIENGIINNSLQQQLIVLYQFSKKYPNSGTLNKELQKLYDSIEKLKSIKATEVKVLVSILSNIAFRNPKTYPGAFAILSRVLDVVKDENEKKEFIKEIQNRFRKLPNTEYLDIWLQRISLKIDIDNEIHEIQYETDLCKKVSDNAVEIWDSSWLNDDLKKIMASAEIIDQKIIDEMGPVIDREEVALFKLNIYI